MQVDHKNFPCQRYAHYDSTIMQQSPTTHRLLLPAVDTWDRLSALKMYSQDRRLERYQIIYTWKILKGITPNVGIKPYTSTSRLPVLSPQIKQCATGKIGVIREGSLQIRSP